MEFLYFLTCLNDQFLGRLRSTSNISLSDRKEFSLGAIEQVKNIRFLIISLFDNLIGHFNKPTLDIFLDKDTGMKLNISRRGDPFGKIYQISPTSYFLERTILEELILNSHQVYRLRILEQLIDSCIDLLVSW